jgi:hypothetical protein
MPPQNQEIAEFWHRWEEYFTAKGRKDPRIWAQAAICLGKLQELAGSHDEAACAQSIQECFFDVSAQRAKEMYQELVAHAKGPPRDSVKKEEFLRFNTFPPESG